MITEMTIRNFKGAGGFDMGGHPVSLKLNPITLIFGANSAGKSSFFHALHYAREILLHHNLDATVTDSGGQHVDLGGFEKLVHMHDLESTISLEFTFSMKPSDFNCLGIDWSWVHMIESFDLYDQFDFTQHLRTLLNPSSPELKACVGIDVSWDKYEKKPYVSSLSTRFEAENGRLTDRFSFIETVIDSSGDRVPVFRLGPLSHSLLKYQFLHPNTPEPPANLPLLAFWDEGGGNWRAPLAEFLRWAHLPSKKKYGNSPADPDTLIVDNSNLFNRGDGGKYLDNDFDFVLSQKGDALVSLEKPLRLFEKVTRGFVHSEIDFGDQYLHHDGEDLYASTMDEEKLRPSSELAISHILSTLTLAPVNCLRKHLEKFRYLGPLREVPDRNYKNPVRHNSTQWASGLAAWDELYKNAKDGDGKLVTQVGDWLSNEDKLDTGYTVDQREQLLVDAKDPAIIKLLAGRAIQQHDPQLADVLTNASVVTDIVISPVNTPYLELKPQNVGMGISQVLPVVVAALFESEKFLAIEQPELHLHPRVQAGLADLFIEAALGDHHQQIFVETHSEVIPLRIMRRIREGSVQPDILNIAYVESYEGETVVTTLEIGEDGSMLDPWPDGFFEEGFRERFSE